MKQYQNIILEYLDGNENIEYGCQNIIMVFTNDRIQADPHELKSILHLISSISNDHHRTTGFIQKIESIILNLKNEIIKFYTNDEIFNIFKHNKRILLFLFNEKIIHPNAYISSIITLPQYQEKKYPEYFFNEFKSFFTEKLTQKVESEISDEIQNLKLFDEKRYIGENDNFICQLIRNDSIDDFIYHINKSNVSLSSEISCSIFETNVFLNRKMPTIIEYSAFFGSVNIFKYLFLNKVELTSSLWNYAVHGQNSEIIHLLEEKQIQPLKKYYNNCLCESFKCHHNDIAEYLQTNILNEFELSSIFKSHNYELFPSDLNNDFNTLFYLCKYDYFFMVQSFLNERNFDVNCVKIFVCI